ncbi:hypothetical protein BKI52_02120 [marine bacterium AO1-C]|nr:hypothetical protein BKI52_02120 [marine bacterium AO1-C]
MQELIELLKPYDFLGPEEFKIIQEASSIQHLKAEEHLFKEGDYFYYACFVLKGVMRAYEISPIGEERTIYIATEGLNIGSLETKLRHEQSRRFAQAIEDCTILLLDTRIMHEKERQYPMLMEMKIVNMERLLLNLSERSSFFALRSPEERFMVLQEKQPELLNRIPQKYLASYIGVSTVSFSRIKARIQKKEQVKRGN